MSNYRKLYDEKIIKGLKDEFKYSSIMEVPKLEKIVVVTELVTISLLKQQLKI